MKIRITIKKLYEDDAKITGAIVTSHSSPQNAKELFEMESIMKHHVHDKIFPNEGLTFYPSGSSGLVSFIALININGMKETQENIDYTLHYSSDSPDFQ
ncbi:MAG: hypothetical protein K0S23_633 [Fluviicola sp.]|jgi:hypothetical protein|uniref:hypothetical protein n=1 Tax=Fluviicola sp. TaxID=1917219 RepID=UPI002628438A|nr:hypothetical protein [Fluviicola sp.]MDF3026326.1 hypothetical protein [Fluviicola sp.]